MKKDNLDFNKFKIVDLDEDVGDESLEIETISHSDIAIIGMAGRLPKAENLQEFWDNLVAGRDCIDQFPDNRKKDIEGYLLSLGYQSQDLQYSQGGYLEEIDKFDPLFFNITPKEASVMDPNQRIFLTTAWQAIEDAGYGGKKMVGSKTGVYVGFSNDSQTDYRFLVSEIEPENVELSITGNIRSIIASRISYFLDLKGPTIMVDSACSSTLAAVHLACTELHRGRCEMAIVGGVKITYAPLTSRSEVAGIRSKTSRARTFDNASDGTGFGEGAVAILLKPLHRAIKDRDNVYAVIRGTGMNQDGASAGITAPNFLAQADLIDQVWKETGINPETISYMEAHGTGTPLGDPIEVAGIEEVFKRYTSKKQFVGVGSVKTNIGHLDNVAGIAGLVKTALALKNRCLPPTLHFTEPNRKIDFLHSPVYVVEKLKKLKEGENPLRCGVSAFGLSGNNCHLLLEEFDHTKIKTESVSGPYLLTLSAKSNEVLLQLVQEYREFLKQATQIDPGSLSYTANTGRGHYNQRLVIVYNTIADLVEQLSNILKKGFEHLPDRVYYGSHKLVSQNRELRREGDITEEEITELNQKTSHIIAKFHTGRSLNLLQDLCQLYVKGAEIDWEDLYQGEAYQKVSLPVYPFERRRCWLTMKDKSRKIEVGEDVEYIEHPLLDRVLCKSFNQDVYHTIFTVNDYWVLKEHLVRDKYILPGTVYVEMAREVASRYYPDQNLQFKNILFLSPMIVGEREKREAQTIIIKKEDHLEYVIASKLDGEMDEWVRHSEGKIYPLSENPNLEYQIEELHKGFGEVIVPDYSVIPTDSAIITGPRWKNINKIHVEENRVLIEMELRKEFSSDINYYGLHPSLLDTAVNIAIQSIGQGLYLPFTYKDFKLYGRIPAKFYSYVRHKGEFKTDLETGTFDVDLIDESGKVFGQVTDYTLKKVHKLRDSREEDNLYHQITWVPAELTDEKENSSKGRVLIFIDEKGLANRLVEGYLGERDVILVEFGEEFAKIGSKNYTICGCDEGDYQRLLAELKEEGLAQIIHLSSIFIDSEVKSLANLQERTKRGADSLFFLTKALLNENYREKLELVLVSEEVNLVTGEETSLAPEAATLIGLGKVIGKEYPNLSVRSIDIDQYSVDSLITELQIVPNLYQVAYRHGKRYVEEFRRVKIDELADSNFELKRDGVYLITGGTGGIGLEIAKYLVERAEVGLALINRTPFPERDRWEEILKESEDEKLVTKINMVRELESKAREVSLYAADVTDEEQMKNLIIQLREKHGRINGIIHGAGLAGDGFIIRKGKDVFDSVLAPKVVGTMLLDRLTIEDNPDFFINFSSISSILGNPGQGDYTAANSYLDAFADYRNKQGRSTLTINWPAWKETGMAVDFGANRDGLFKSISTSTAILGFDQVLTKIIPRVAICQLNIEQILGVMDMLPFKISTELAKILRGKERSVQHSKENKDKELAIKTNLDSSTPGEFEIGQIWSQVLGIEDLDIYENLFDLGGDSITATRLYQEIDQRYPGVISISDIFTYPSVYEISKFIDNKLNRSKEQLSVESEQEAKKIVEEQKKADLKDLLEQLSSGKISMDEVKKKI